MILTFSFSVEIVSASTTYDFEGDGIGAVPAGWLDSSSGACSARVSNDVAHGGTKSVKFVDSNNNGWSILDIQNQFDEEEMTFWIYMFDYNRVIGIYTYENGVGTDILAYVWYAPDNKIYAYDGAIKTELYAGFNKETWIKMQIIHDLVADTFDVYIDNVLEADDFDFLNGAATTFKSCRFMTGKTINLGTMGYIDDVTIGEVIGDYISNDGIVASDLTPNDEQWFFLNVSLGFSPNASTFTYNRIDIDPTGMNLSCGYTNSTDTFAEENDPNNYLQIDEGPSDKIDLSSTNIRVNYYIRIHVNATLEGNYNVTIYSTTSDGLNDTDTFVNVFSLTMRTPSAPTQLFGAGFNATSPYVELHWSHDLLTYDTFQIDNSTNGSDWTFLNNTALVAYNDTLVSNGTDRYYKVRACRVTGVGYKNSSFTSMDFETVYFLPFSEGVENGVALIESDAPWVALAIILSIIAGLLVWGSKK